MLEYHAAFTSKVVFFLEKNTFFDVDKTSSYQHIKSVEAAFGYLFSDEELEAIAKKNGFIKRSRKMSASAFMQSLVFNEETHDKLSLLDLKFDLVKNAGLKISKEAIHKRFTPAAVSFLMEVFSSLLSSHINIGEARNSADCSFTGIYIKDSTKFKLPTVFAKDYPSYGSYGKNTSIMNIQYEFELLSGNWHCLELTKATRNDQQDSRETVDDIKEGGLYLRDLGYITMTYLNAVIKNKAYYLNRLPHMGVFQKTDDKFKQVDWKKIDKIFKTSDLENLELEVYIGGKEKLKTRLVIVPVPDQVANERIRKAERGGKRKNGYKLSKEYKIKAHYNLYITNAPEQTLNTMEVVETYRLRWQIELMFKTWKSHLNIQKNKPMKIERYKCQLIAKLIWILINTKLFQITNIILRQQNQSNGCSSVKFFKWIKTLSQELRQVLCVKQTLAQWFYSSVIPIVDDFVIEKRLKKKTHCEILSSFHPS